LCVCVCVCVYPRAQAILVQARMLEWQMALHQALDKVRASGNSKEVVHECFLTLHKIAENAAQKWNPTTGAKFRIIKQSSATITNKVTALSGGKDCLLALGFIDALDEGEPVWRIPQDKAHVDKLWDGLALLRTEKDNLASVAVDKEKSEAANKAGGIEGTIRDMLTSPAKLNQILRNPMFKQMIASNPDMVEGFLSSMPEARETLTIYPEMREQLEAVMGRPLRFQEVPAATPSSSAPGSQPVAGVAGGLSSGPLTALTVQAYVYDVTQGMAKGMSQMLVGKQIDCVPHTGIVVFGREYFFGGGPSVSDNPGKSVPVPVVETMVLGETGKTRQELEAHINNVLALEHNESNYNLLNHNCNHYASDVTKFLLDGKGLPDRIVNFGQDALDTPQGQQLRVMIEGMERNMRQSAGGSGMNPFGSNTSGAAPMNTVSGTTPSADDPHAGIVAQLLEMGFPADRCQQAAARSEGDFDLALALLMSEGD